MHWMSVHHVAIRDTLFAAMLLGTILLGRRNTQRHKGSPKNAFDTPILVFALSAGFLFLLVLIFTG